MLALLLFSSFFATIGYAEKLSPLRKSCIYADILTESNKFEWNPTRIEFPVFPDWDKAIKTYCSEFDITSNPNRAKTITETLEKQNDESGLFSVKRNPKNKLEIIAQLFESNTAYPELWRARSKLDSKLHTPMGPKNPLGNIVKNAKCLNGNSVNLEVQVKEWVSKRVWICEDIGRKVNGTYEFYTIPKIWMFEDEGGVTKMVEKERCDQKEKEYQCRSAEAIHDAVCSINNVEKCRKNRVIPKNNDHSYHRTLVGGTAIFGSFKKLTFYEKPDTEILHIHPRLYYLGFGNSTLVTIDFNN